MDPYTLSKSRWRSFSKTGQGYNSHDCPCCWGYHKRKRGAFKRDFADELEREYRVGRSRYSTTSADVFVRFFWEDPYKFGGYPPEDDLESSSDLTLNSHDGVSLVPEAVEDSVNKVRNSSHVEEDWELVSNGTVRDEGIEDWESIDSWDIC